MPNHEFFSSHGAYVNCAIIVMLYTHSIRNQLQNRIVVFKMHDSVSNVRYPAFVLY